jgi:hypothetical protein
MYNNHWKIGTLEDNWNYHIILTEICPSGIFGKLEILSSFSWGYSKLEISLRYNMVERCIMGIFLVI